MNFLQIATVLLVLRSCRALDTEWWRHPTIYEIFLKSFKDSNGDGVGDLKGVTSKLDYLVDIGIDTVWITPFFSSSGADGGYDIKNFKEIDPAYGTMEDFEELMKEMKKRGMNFIMDLVINHSSDEHEWFEKSLKRIDPYTDYYIWADPKGHGPNDVPIPPNNWVSIFNFTIPSSCWTWHDARKQFYFHQFGVKQPDLNLRNSNVKKELKEMMKFWLDKGVAGFRVDAIAFFMEDPLLRDDEHIDALARWAAGTEDGFSHRLNHPENYDFLNELRVFLRVHDRKTKKERESIMMGEIYGTIDVIMKYYGTEKMPAVHFPYNFRLTTIRTYLDAQQMNDYLTIWVQNLPRGMAQNWALGNHDQGRIFERFSKEYNYILLALVTMLPGSSCIYYGEEASQELFDFAPGKVRDLWVERDHFRSPMQWDDTWNAGFTSAEKAWIPLHPDYWHSNIEAQKTQPNSTLNYFKDLTSLRKTETFKYGDLKFFTISKWVFAFTRTYKESRLIIVLNLGMESNLLDLHANIHDLPATLDVVVASPNSGFVKGEKLRSAPNYPNLSVLRPHSSLVLTATLE